MENKKKNKGVIIVVSIIAALVVIIAGIAICSEIIYQKHRATQLEEALSERSAADVIDGKLETPVVIGEKEVSKSNEGIPKVEENTEVARTEGEEPEVPAVEELPEEQTVDPDTIDDTPVNIGNGHKIAIDAGHQGQGNSEQEPIGPGATETKPKVASGTSGVASGLNEYELNLAVSLKLRDELVSRGYEVFMVRETHEVDISNKERAELAAESGSEILVRVHANGSDNTSISGALTMAPASDNPYLSSELIAKSNALSQDVINGFCNATGANNMGVQGYNNMSGINWTQIPVTIIEMGFMTNSNDDLHMADEEYQNKMVQGMANGIDTYFGTTAS